jgi:acyl carrier protein
MWQATSRKLPIRRKNEPKGVTCRNRESSATQARWCPWLPGNVAKAAPEKDIIMKDTLEGNVRRAVAQHMGLDSSEVRAAHRLSRDLALQPLDVVLIAIRMEEVEQVELPIDRLDSVETVGDLTSLVQRALVAARREDERPSVRLRREQAQLAGR